MAKKVLFINKSSPASVIPEMLAGAGLEISEAYGEETALQRLTSEPYDLVILMENAAAEIWEHCRKIRNHAAAPLIVISSGASTETCIKAINAGADFFLRKPFGPLELMARINALFQRVPSVQSVPLVS